ncbi:UvrD-helicase domain-containing protein [Lyngbya confervoides]|uniref:DNA 3'-5' helicase n=1 Tax=Lyngbya confervoides BDU141951 TaxID=1574623 RepID=A0ABD4T5B1_9CYAN|nr:UvrD-helicase domain-containing protein [Lyngbya confervoides]MCM1983976.1 UvrD-helicase domain-containing protein [Lyngbya confervoides BDU141951]
MSFELIQKPTFLNQLLAIPPEYMQQILGKIQLLADDPSPRGNLKKKLHGYKGKIYRLRSGDFRIIYTYGDGWVALLGVDARKDIYDKKNQLIAEPTSLDLSQLPNLEELLSPAPTPQILSPPTQKKTENLLPTQIDESLLKQLRIPADYHPDLLRCRTLNDLTTIDVPEIVRERVFDCITAPDFDQVLRQPSLITQDPHDLLRYKEGDLLGFLLKLNPEQEKYVTWASNAQGPTLLKGGPGTGKSTVAIYRTRELIQKLRDDGIEQPQLLFTTYTNALVTFSQQLLTQLLGKDTRRVSVQTADSLMRSFVARYQRIPAIAKAPQIAKLMATARQQTIQSLEGSLLQRKAQQIILERLHPNYLRDEIECIIEGRTLTTLEEYLETPRNGRRVRLNQTQRRAIWQLREQFNQQLKQSNLITWAQLRNQALDLLQEIPDPPQFDGVIIDEAQDLPPNTIRFLLQTCQHPNCLFLTADANQSIYGSGFRWSDIHSDLQFVGRTGILRTNHRTTREIDEAAHQYLQSGQLDPDSLTERQYIHAGPNPAVRAVTNAVAQINLLSQFCQTAAREFRLGLGACAILTPSETVGKQMAKSLDEFGLPATFMSSKQLDITRRGIKVITLKSAKGLEFPIVAIAGFLTKPFPPMPKGMTEEAQDEYLMQERRSLFVGMTRAMRALLVIVPAKKPGPLLQDFDPTLWNLGGLPQ